MNFVQYTRERSPELADYLREVFTHPFVFEGDDPLQHSSHNHLHLWKVEYLADTHPWIDVDYRVAFVRCVLEQWRRRLKGLAPYRDRGYRMYVYEDIAPTVSVVAETDTGYPYGAEMSEVAASIREVVQPYENRSWRGYFGTSDSWATSETAILAAVERNGGAIGRPTANQFHIPVGTLRTLITNMGLAREVNAIRKKYHRRPADFSKEHPWSERRRVFERILPAGYR